MNVASSMTIPRHTLPVKKRTPCVFVRSLHNDEENIERDKVVTKRNTTPCLPSVDSYLGGPEESDIRRYPASAYTNNQTLYKFNVRGVLENRDSDSTTLRYTGECDGHASQSHLGTREECDGHVSLSHLGTREECDGHVSQSHLRTQEECDGHVSQSHLGTREECDERASQSHLGSREECDRLVSCSRPSILPYFGSTSGKKKMTLSDQKDNNYQGIYKSPCYILTSNLSTPTLYARYSSSRRDSTTHRQTGPSQSTNNANASHSALVYHPPSSALVYHTPSSIDVCSPADTHYQPSTGATRMYQTQHAAYPSNALYRVSGFNYDCALEVVGAAATGLELPTVVHRRNEREREKVRCVNEGYTILHQRLPLENRDKRVSMVETLRCAIQYIQYLQEVLEESGGGIVPPPTGKDS